MFDIHYRVSDTCLPEYHKDAYHYYHADVYPEWMTASEIEAEYARAEKKIIREMEEEADMEVEALIEWELRLEGLQKQFGISEADAIRWDMQAEDYVHVHQQGLEHYFWKKGLSVKEIHYWTKHTMDLLDLPVWSEEWEESLAA